MGLYDFSYNYLVKWFCDTTKKNRVGGNKGY